MAASESYLVDEAIDLASKWLEQAAESETEAEKAKAEQLAQLIRDPDGISFAMNFIDLVARPQNAKVAAAQLNAMANHSIPGFLSPVDRLMFAAGARLSKRMPRIVVPLAMRRMRSIVGDLVLDARISKLSSTFAKVPDFRKNINLLGEAVLGEGEAEKRFDALVKLIDRPEIDYVSVKISSVAPKLNYWDAEGSFERITERLEELCRVSLHSDPKTFINLDMEEYHDLHLTIRAFKEVLSTEEFKTLDAGIVLQAYLPDSYEALIDLARWANDRHRNGGGTIKIRIVKGANLSMEAVESEVRGWEQAPYATKAEVDANYKRCVDWVLSPERCEGLRIGIASHNLFDVAWAYVVAQDRRVLSAVEFEMLHGMAPAQGREVDAAAESGLLVYTPIVEAKDFDVAIGYLFRRLEENSIKGNFLRALLTIEPGSEEFHTEAAKFTTAVADRLTVSSTPRRQQLRPATQAKFATEAEFVNEPDTDPTLESNIKWAENIAATAERHVQDIRWVDDNSVVADELDNIKKAGERWRELSAAHRNLIVRSVANELAARRGDLIGAMMAEANKTFVQADAEVSEAIDFAAYYGRHAERLTSSDPKLKFSPVGFVTVVPPWNFPCAIPAGGVLSALAAGNAVIFKPAPQTPNCARIVAECCWKAGVPKEALRFMPMHDGEASRKLIAESDCVVLTGASDTAKMFQSWNPKMRLLAETSGKNAIVVTPAADVDQAVEGIAYSAFGHSGQKCSAASIIISVDGACDSPRFVDQLRDAVQGYVLGSSKDLSTDLADCVLPVSGNLQRALTSLDPGERWLVEPAQVGSNSQLWSPGVKVGVRPKSWFQQTECFGPVLGIVSVRSLEEAIKVQNSTDFGLTGGIYSLNHEEIKTWLQKVEVGNAYVNKPITGAIVQRQPFGGWKRSNVGPGAKAGGPNYLDQLGTWTDSSDRDAQWLAKSKESDNAAWEREFSKMHDPTGLRSERNILRYARRNLVAICGDSSTSAIELERVSHAADTCGVATEVLLGMSGPSLVSELARMANRAEPLERVIYLGVVPEELLRFGAEYGIYIDNAPITHKGDLELRRFMKEQALSITNHRFGNFTNQLEF